MDLWWRKGQGCGRNGPTWQTKVQISSKVWFRAAATVRYAHYGYRLTVCPWVQDSHAPLPGRELGNSGIDSPETWLSHWEVSVIQWTLLPLGLLGQLYSAWMLKYLHYFLPWNGFALTAVMSHCLHFPECCVLVASSGTALQQCLCFHTVWTNDHIS